MWREYYLDSCQLTGHYWPTNLYNLSTKDTPAGAVTLDPPIASAQTDPLGLTAVPVTLSWSATSPQGFISYQVYRATHPGVTTADTLVATIADATTTSATDMVTGMIGTTYYYRVFTVLSGGESMSSNEQSVALADPVPAAGTVTVTIISPSSGDTVSCTIQIIAQMPLHYPGYPDLIFP